MAIFLLQFIINLFTAIFDFIAGIIQFIIILIWHNLFDIIISFIRKAMFMLFRHSRLGYKTEEKLSSAKKAIKKKSKFDKNKIIEGS